MSSVYELGRGRAQFYEQYTAQQIGLAGYCKKRFNNEILGGLPPSSQKGVQGLLDHNFTDIFGTHRVLGGYLTPWIAETVGINDSKTIAQVAFASFVGRFSFILWDYQMDEPEMVRGITDAIEPLRLIALNEYGRCIPDGLRTPFTDKTAALLNDSRVANDLEIERRGKIVKPYTEDELRVVGEKIAVVNCTTYALGLAAEDLAASEQLVKVMSNLLVAIQLNHDITDAQEDLSIQNCTAPLALALHHVAGANTHFDDIRVAQPDILETLYDEDVLHESLEWVNTFAQKGIEESDGLPNCPFRTHLQNMIERNRNLLVAVQTTSSPDERRQLVIETLKRNQGHPQRHGITFK